MKSLVIIGCGKTGAELAKEFSRFCNVTVVDKNMRALDSLGDNFNGRKILGDALDIKVLELAEIKETDAVVLVTGNDNLNLVVGKIVKDRYKVKKVVLQIYDTAKREIFQDKDLIIIDKTSLLVKVFKECIL